MSSNIVPTVGHKNLSSVCPSSPLFGHSHSLGPSKFYYQTNVRCQKHHFPYFFTLWWSKLFFSTLASVVLLRPQSPLLSHLMSVPWPKACANLVVQLRIQIQNRLKRLIFLDLLLWLIASPSLSSSMYQLMRMTRLNELSDKPRTSFNEMKEQLVEHIRKSRARDQRPSWWHPWLPLSTPTLDSPCLELYGVFYDFMVCGMSILFPWILSWTLRCSFYSHGWLVSRCFMNILNECLLFNAFDLIWIPTCPYFYFMMHSILINTSFYYIMFLSQSSFYLLVRRLLSKCDFI